MLIWEHLQDHALAKEFGRVRHCCPSCPHCYCGMFVYACITTIRRKGRKKKTGFYRKFCCFYSAYLVPLVFRSLELSSAVVAAHTTSFLITGPRCCIGGIVFFGPPQLRRNFPVSAAIADEPTHFRQRAGENPTNLLVKRQVKSVQEKEETQTGSEACSCTAVQIQAYLRPGRGCRKDCLQIARRKSAKQCRARPCSRRRAPECRHWRRSSVQDGFDGPSRRGDVEMTRVSYGGNGPDSAAAVTARAPQAKRSLLANHSFCILCLPSIRVLQKNLHFFKRPLLFYQGLPSVPMNS